MRTYAGQGVGGPLEPLRGSGAEPRHAHNLRLAADIAYLMRLASTVTSR